MLYSGTLVAEGEGRAVVVATGASTVSARIALMSEGAVRPRAPVEEELDRRNLPMELKHVPIIESALNPRAVSRQGATGLWQIMYRTGRSLDLRIDTYVDERRDPQRATEAGLDYLMEHEESVAPA